MRWQQWVLVAWLSLSALAVFVRGTNRQTRTYTAFDAWSGLFEVGALIWLVTTL